MSSSATPTELLAHLSLDPQMSPTSEEVQSRAAEIRDILSSFDRELLPSEFRTDIFPALDRTAVLPPQKRSEWTIQADLNGTLLQWGAFDENAHRVLVQIQTPITRARCFEEKLGRRFEDLFDKYDIMSTHGVDPWDEGSAEQYTRPSQLRNEVERFARRFETLVAAVVEDRKYRELGQKDVCERVFNALVGVCERDVDLILHLLPSQDLYEGRTSSEGASARAASLFHALIDDTGRQSPGRLFMLDLLEGYPPLMMGSILPRMRNLVARLHKKEAPTDYLIRMQRLVSRVEDSLREAGQQVGLAPEPGASRHGSASTNPAASAVSTPEVEPSSAKRRRRDDAPPESRTGTRRSAAEGSSRRDKKKPTR